MPRHQTRIPNTRVPCQADVVELGGSRGFGATDAQIRAATARVSAFVKVVYALIGCAALVFFLIRMREGGSLAAAAELASAGLLCAVGALVVIFGALAVSSSLRK